jgi:hypothetical protein
MYHTYQAHESLYNTLIYLFSLFLRRVVTLLLLKPIGYLLEFETVDSLNGVDHFTMVLIVTVPVPCLVYTCRRIIKRKRVSDRSLALSNLPVHS